MASHWAGLLCHNRSAQPAREAGMQRWQGREAQSVLSHCLQMVLPLLLIKEGVVGGGVSDLLNGMTGAYKTRDYQLTVSKTSAGPFNRSCPGLYGGEGTHHTLLTPWMIYLFYDPSSEVLRDLFWQTLAFQMNWHGKGVLENGIAFNQCDWPLILAFAVPLSFLSSSSSPHRGPPV